MRAARDRRGVAAAELFVAGILPNPQLNGSVDFITGGTIRPELADRLRFRRELGFPGAHSAWRETRRGSRQRPIGLSRYRLDRNGKRAEAAKQAFYRVISDEAQLAYARQVDARLQKNLGVVRQATAGA